MKKFALWNSCKGPQDITLNLLPFVTLRQALHLH